MLRSALAMCLSACLLAFSGGAFADAPEGWDEPPRADDEADPPTPAATPAAPPAAAPSRRSPSPTAPPAAERDAAPAATPTPVAAGPADLLPGPPLFAETAPLLPELLRALDARRPAAKSLAAGLRALDDFLRQDPPDPIARATALFLRARLLVALDRRSEALDALDALAKAGGVFADDARLLLADLAPKRGRDTEARAEWLLTRSPGATAYLDGLDEGVKVFKRLKKLPRAVTLVEQALGQSMSPSLRTSLLLRLADLYKATGATADAVAVLRAWYWSNRSAPSKGLVKAMTGLKAAPDDDEDFLRRALHAGRAGSRKLDKDMGKVKRPKRTPAWVAAEALAARWTGPEEALAALDRAMKKNAALETAPEMMLARAMLLRRLDRDAEAIDVFRALTDAHPRHPLAGEARDQAAVVLRRLGRAAEADVMDEDLLALAMAGPYHRDALWRLGFGAVLRREATIAERWLSELERRYGNEPDRHSFSWFERARYWRGRAAALGGRDGVAAAHWTGLVARYPAGWYALLARHRLGKSREEVIPTGTWDVAPDDPMATALAWYRLGAEREAMQAFEALMDAWQLPGNGRKLLADLLIVHGDARKAERVMKFASIPPTMPGDDPAEMYYAWYPMPHGEDVTSAAEGQGVPRHLLAGVVSVETRFNATTKSSVGAIGLAQVMPSTGESLGKRLFGDSFKANQLWDPATNLTVAAKYIGDLLGRFKGHPALAVAAYNAGPTPVRRWLDERGELELDAWVETIPYEEARRYVMRVLSDAEIYRRLYQLDGRPLNIPLRL
jgi:soluble lytic murein transglycosylase